MVFSIKNMIKNKMFLLSFPNGFIQIKSEVKTRKLNIKGLLICEYCQDIFSLVRLATTAIVNAIIFLQTLL